MVIHDYMTTISCEKCSNEFSIEHKLSESAMRKIASKHGWLVFDNKDICPQCIFKIYTFDHPNGYAAVYTRETTARMNTRRKGRPYIRFNIIKRDGTGETTVISNITLSELQMFRTIAEEQGNKIW